jgi:hypothetical protein
MEEASAPSSFYGSSVAFLRSLSSRFRVFHVEHRVVWALLVYTELRRRAHGYNDIAGIHSRAPESGLRIQSLTEPIPMVHVAKVEKLSRYRNASFAEPDRL